MPKPTKQDPFQENCGFCRFYAARGKTFVCSVNPPELLVTDGDGAPIYIRPLPEIASTDPICRDFIARTN